METKPIWVRRNTDWVPLLAGIGGGPLALDTEADSLHHYHEKVCLLQLAFDDAVALVDPLDGADPRALGPVLADSGVLKVLHGADYDIRVLHRDFGLVFRGLFDTAVAARLTGATAVGLGALLETELGVHVNKAFQRADWSRRPLPPEMVQYAAEDTRHLRELAAILQDRLERLGRADWAREEFQRLESVRWKPSDGTEERFRRVRGAGRLPARSLAILRELYAVREELARDRDVPPFRVLGSHTLLSLVQAAPRNLQELRSVRGLPRSFGRGDAAETLLAAVRRAVALPGDRLPEVVRSRRRRTDPEIESAYREARARRDRLAADLGIEPSLLATRSMLEEALRARKGGRAVEQLTEVRRWQLPFLRAILDGQAP